MPVDDIAKIPSAMDELIARIEELARELGRTQDELVVAKSRLAQLVHNAGIQGECSLCHKPVLWIRHTPRTRLYCSSGNGVGLTIAYDATGAKHSEACKGQQHG